VTERKASLLIDTARAFLQWGKSPTAPHQPHTGGTLIDHYPWHLALDEAERLLNPSRTPS
jgi:hypothetical protein